MASWPILSVVTFLPLVGALFCMVVQGPKEAVDRNCRSAAMITSLVTFLVSLLLWEGHSLTYVAEQAGHSIATLARHYAGTMRELETKPRVPAAEAIGQAREDVRGTL